MIARTYPTPAGTFSALIDDEAIVASGFEPPDALHARCEASLRARRIRRGTAPWLDDAIAAYLDGDVRTLDALPVRQAGTAFRLRLWESLRRVPAGERVSYAKLAVDAGAPRATRAAGSACATNRVALIVPCHRVVRADGALGGYRYGVAIKEWLLAHERAHA